MQIRLYITIGYDYIWQLVVEMPIPMTPIPNLVLEELWNYWLFDGKKAILAMHENDVYPKLIKDGT